MLTETLTSLPLGRSLAVLADGRIVVGTSGGIRVYPPGSTGSAAPTTVLALGGRVRALVPHPDGSAVVAGVVGRGLVSIALDAPTPVVSDLVSAAGITTIDVAQGSRAVVVGLGRPAARVIDVDLDTAAVTPVTSGLATPVGIADDPASGRIIVAASSASTDLLSIERATGIVTPVGLAGTLGSVTSIAFRSAAHDELVVADGAGRMLSVAVVGGVPVAPATVVVDSLDRVWGAVPAADGSVLIAEGSRLVRFIEQPVVVPPVKLVIGADPLHVSSWSRIAVELDGSIPFTDLTFVTDPPAGGLVSPSQDASDDPSKPSILLASGGITGDFALLALDPIGQVVAKEPFTVTDAWTGTQGPPVAYFGAVNDQQPDGTWGGGDPFVPQNIDVHKTVGTRNVAVVVVETSDCPVLGAADAATLRATLDAEVFTGTVESGVTESARAYFQRVSYGAYDIANAGIVGPVRLPSPWTSYATTVGGSGDTSDLGTFSQAAIAEVYRQNRDLAAAGQPPLVDLTTVDSVVIVVRSIAADPANGIVERFHWPFASRPGGFQKSFQVDATAIQLLFGQIEIPVMRTIQVLSMPDDWAARDVREFRETVTHELTHNIGLPDEYARTADSVDAHDREVGDNTVGQSWTLMNFEQEFPEPTAVEKMLLGWVRPEWVRALSFTTLGPIDEDIELHALELGAPPAGRVSAVEIRKGDGTNAYFEYRREQPAIESDQDLPATNTVLGTEFISGDVAPATRRNLLLIADDSDNDDGEFQQGDDYRETDTTSPEYPNDLKMTVLQTAADFARIHIVYGDQKPDPQIRPWAASTNWQSQDIEVKNSRSAANAAFRNVPWAGHPNSIEATVRNPGDVDATGVAVDFFWKDFTFSEGTEHFLGRDVRDVVHDTDVVFTAPNTWTPPVLPILGNLGITFTGHFCVVARIAEYADPVIPNLKEVTPANNEAQSNYNVVISSSASPSTREGQVLTVRNPQPTRARIYTSVRQTSPFVRVYLGAEWVELDPGEEANITILTESVIGDPNLRDYQEKFQEFEPYRHPSHLNITGIADSRESCHGEVLGGAHIVTISGRATRVIEFFAGDGVAFGRVETVDTGEPVDGPILVTVVPEEGAAEKEVSVTGVVKNGSFRVSLRELMEQGERMLGWVATAHYLGQVDKAPCTSDPFRIES